MTNELKLLTIGLTADLTGSTARIASLTIDCLQHDEIPRRDRAELVQRFDAALFALAHLRKALDL